MAKTTRDRMKGSIATAVLDLERALDQLGEVYITFEPVHPELAEGFGVASALINKAQEVIEQVYIAAWGDLPGDWSRTRDRK